MKLSLPRLDTSIGHVEANAAMIVELASEASVEGASVLLTPELGLCGYPPRDLLLREGFVDRCEHELETIASSVPQGMLVLVGHPESGPERGGRCYNTLSACRDGQVVARARKQLLPGYDVFDEDRYFQAGDEPAWVEHEGHRIGLLVCEDLWQADDVREQTNYEVDPVASLVELGCDVLVAISASPFVAGKHERQCQALGRLARRHRVTIVTLNRAGAEDDLVFDGAAIVANPDGTIECCRDPFGDQIHAFHELGKPYSASNAEMPPDQQRFLALVESVRGYVSKTGNQRVLIGLSGGIDSAVTAAIAAAAIGGENVIGVMMPSRHSSDHSLADSRELADRLGLAACLEVPIESIHHSVVESVRQAGGALGPLEDGSLADQNIQARARGIILMALSNAHGGLVLSTGNKSEMAAGYATLYGDMCGALAVLGDVLKMDVYGLANWMNTNAASCGFSSAPIPESSITKPPSAELRPDQVDQDSLPPYDMLDEIVRRWIEEEQSAIRLVEETGFDSEVVNRMLRMIDLAQFKRDQAAIIPKVSRRAFGRGRPWPVIARPGAAPAWRSATSAS
ncbi:MAG: NAD+ synthase [Phycisphaerae bacterium]|nr:NAD+ synthase [Phycisphaerae bacterium]